ncbi:hypothetical protein IEQ34_016812 [Dendrobium chrysotoxum]|uniref:RNA helicase n=1 Tax=Dendrobium chrysotoxum TaxID=161865 RepID=A0AAV7GGM5_DENCH|nr:hypothetical protein IEQ34_016812 [Dendrobium chrysotoxum]
MIVTVTVTEIKTANAVTIESMRKKQAAQHEKELARRFSGKGGMGEKSEEVAAQRKKEDAAKLYNAFDLRVDWHWTEKTLKEMTKRDWRIFREEYNISYKGSHISRPMCKWSESKLSTELLKAVKKAGYKKPSPIQMAAIPLGLQQCDVIGIAETGSRKTTAFVLPMHMYITRLPPMTKENEAASPYAVVMAPTRELAQQIEDEAVKFAHYLGIKVFSIVGGQSIEEQEFKLRQGYIAFGPQVVGVLDAMPSSNLKPENEDEELDEKRIYQTTYMFSATMPPVVERLARKYLRNPVVVTIGTAGKATDLITQQVIMLKESEKMQRLLKLLDDPGNKTAIVFCNTKKKCRCSGQGLEKMGYKSNSPVLPELSRHEASKFKLGTIPDGTPRRNDIIFAQFGTVEETMEKLLKRYICIGRAGQLVNVESLIKSMTIEADGDIWKNLLSAFKIFDPRRLILMSSSTSLPITRLDEVELF